MRRHVVVLLAAAVFPTFAAAREWTDDTGRYRREAEYLYEENGEVWLRDAGGMFFVIDLARLSPMDRAYVASRRAAGSSDTAGAPAKTLSYRMPTVEAASDRIGQRVGRMLTEARVARLTGWHCSGGHCHVVHHPPIKPCPTPPDKGKRIYQGRWSTFHLVCRDTDGSICGTGAYKFMDQKGCCHEYLELLRFRDQVSGWWLLYEVASPSPPLGIRYWLFEDTSFSRYHYNVYYLLGMRYVWYDCARLRIPE